eukprot:CAMPEP_0194055188 /NCGR_PEP_ID=MMETSP0009_2-20130614/55870_1 /TAXON_ID=210454 /ORGANISM="Grammatophora oceanica, Strain CCMP 410" /LENGTH=106 /DNA_ID=CAMNT_0038704001 /DNA_START=825 /DNA_END=1142 /DNA_ORIENTATION=+
MHRKRDGSLMVAFKVAKVAGEENECTNTLKEVQNDKRRNVHERAAKHWWGPMVCEIGRTKYTFKPASPLAEKLCAACGYTGELSPNTPPAAPFLTANFTACSETIF